MFRKWLLAATMTASLNVFLTTIDSPPAQMQTRRSGDSAAKEVVGERGDRTIWDKIFPQLEQFPFG